MRRTRPLVSWLLLAASLAGANLAEARPPQVRPGAIAGRVVDFDDTPLAGVAVELRGPFPENARRSTVSDGDAHFVFETLAPGRYRLSIEFPELSARSDVDVTVDPGRRTETVLVLSLQATKVNVIVQAEAPAVADTDLMGSESTAGRRIVPGTTIENLPLPAEQVLEVLPLLPTVVRDSKGQLAIDGALPADSVLLFNGIDLMDGYSGAYNVRLPTEAIDSVDVFTGVAPAAYGNMAGGIVDVTTLPGGESWDWDVASVFPRPRFEDGTIHGIKSFSPRLKVSGPIKPGKSYVSIAGGYLFNRVDVYDIPGDANPDYVQVEGWNAFAQFDWRPQERHSFTVAGLVFPGYDKYVGLDGLTPPQATLNVERDAEAVFARHSFRIDGLSSLDTTVQFNRIGLRAEPQGRDPYLVSPGGFDGNHFHGEDRQTSHLEGKMAYRRFLERSGGRSHTVQLGVDFDRFHLVGDLRDDTIVVRGADDRMLQRIDFSGPVSFSETKYEWSLFAADRWTLGDRFWTDLGVRYSSDSYSRDYRVAPRVGVAWDIFGDRRTLLKGATGIVYRRIYLGEIVWEQLPTRLETTFDEAGDGATLAALAPRVAGELEAPRTTQFTADFSHRLESGWLLRARYSRRHTDDNIIFDRVDGAGTHIDGVVDPALQFASQGALPGGSLLLSSTGEATAWSVEVTAAKRIPTGGEFFISYVRSSSFGDLNDFTRLTSELPDPVIRSNRRAQRPFDAPHRIVGWGTVELPAGILLTPAVEWRSGFPYSVLAEDQSYLGAANGERFPNFFALDAQLTRSFEIKGHRFTAGLKASNVTGHDNPRQVVSNIAASNFGELRNSVPLKIRAKLSFGF